MCVSVLELLWNLRIAAPRTCFAFLGAFHNREQRLKVLVTKYREELKVRVTEF